MQKTRFSAISPANSLQFYIIPAPPRTLGQLYRQNPQCPFLVVLWWGVGVQYKPQDPSYQIQNASKIQTLFIIQDKKKAPAKGPKFIVGVINCERTHLVQCPNAYPAKRP